jgi:hypothetical protein
MVNALTCLVWEAGKHSSEECGPTWFRVLAGSPFTLESPVCKPRAKFSREYFGNMKPIRFFLFSLLKDKKEGREERGEGSKEAEKRKREEGRERGGSLLSPRSVDNSVDQGRRKIYRRVTQFNRE